MFIEALVVEINYVIPFLTLLLGGLIGNRLALGRDKRKEYNDAVYPLREKLIHQIDDLSNQRYVSGINDKEIIKLVSVLGEKETKKISPIYERYSRYRLEAGTSNEYHQFTINEVGFGLFLNESKRLLKALDLK
jgi:hypothetical protein